MRREEAAVATAARVRRQSTVRLGGISTRWKLLGSRLTFTPHLCFLGLRSRRDLPPRRVLADDCRLVTNDFATSRVRVDLPTSRNFCGRFSILEVFVEPAVSAGREGTGL